MIVDRFTHSSKMKTWWPFVCTQRNLKNVKKRLEQREIFAFRAPFLRKIELAPILKLLIFLCLTKHAQQLQRVIREMNPF